MRDTMPMPAGLMEGLLGEPSGVTRPTGGTNVPVTRPRVPFVAHAGLVSGLALSPDGKLLASAGIDGRVRLWDVSGPAAKELGTFPRAGTEFQSVAFAPDDEYVVAGGVARNTAGVWRWDWKDGRVAEWGQYQGEKVGVPALAFTPDGKRLAAAIGPFVVAFKVAGRQAGAGEILKGHAAAVRAVAWSPDGKRLGSGGESGQILVWAWGWLGASQKAKVRAHTEVITALSVSPDGTRMAAAGLDKAVVLWDADDPKEGSAVSLTGHGDNVRAVQFLRDGTLASVSQTGQMILWDARAAVALAEFHLSDRMPICIAVSADGRRVATGSTDGKVAVFETVRAASGTTVGT
jgi:WD40 repeat protein